MIAAQATSSGSLDGGYILNVTYKFGDIFPYPSNSHLVVLETYNNYFLPPRITTTTIPISF
jgi:hypothetical protein